MEQIDGKAHLAQPSEARVAEQAFEWRVEGDGEHEEVGAEARVEAGEVGAGGEEVGAEGGEEGGPGPEGGVFFRVGDEEEGEGQGEGGGEEEEGRGGGEVRGEGRGEGEVGEEEAKVDVGSYDSLGEKWS